MADQRKQELTRRMMEMSDEMADCERRLSNLRVEFAQINHERMTIIREEQERAQHEQTYLGL